MLFPVSHWGGAYFEVVIAANTFDYNLNTALSALGWDGLTPCEVRVTVNAGVKIGATSAPNAAFRDTLPAGSRVTLIMGLGAKIEGPGGAGGATSTNNSTGRNGGAGGPALSIGCDYTIDNTLGSIWGGGGGGGAGGTGGNSGDEKASAGGGGGGGAGLNAGAGGAGQNQGSGTSGSGGPGTETTAGSGGGHAPAGTSGQLGGDGGAGGLPGQAGTNGGNGAGSLGPTGGLGGAAGKAIELNGHSVTWVGGNADPNLKGAVS